MVLSFKNTKKCNDNSTKFGDYVNCVGYHDFKPCKCRVNPQFKENCRNESRQKTLYGLQFIPWFVTHIRNKHTLDLIMTERPIRTPLQMFSLIRPLFRGKCEAKHLPHLVMAFINGDEQLRWLRTNNWTVLQTLKTEHEKLILNDNALKLKVDFSAEYSYSKHWKGFRLVENELNEDENALKFLGPKLSCMYFFCFFVLC